MATKPPVTPLSTAQYKVFDDLLNRLEPERLSCDGELSRAQVEKRRAALLAQWREKEREVGRNVDQEEVFQWSLAQWNAKRDAEKTVEKSPAPSKPGVVDRATYENFMALFTKRTEAMRDWRIAEQALGQEVGEKELFAWHQAHSDTPPTTTAPQTGVMHHSAFEAELAMWAARAAREDAEKVSSDTPAPAPLQPGVMNRAAFEKFFAIFRTRGEAARDWARAEREFGRRVMDEEIAYWDEDSEGKTPPEKSPSVATLLRATAKIDPDDAPMEAVFNVTGEFCGRLLKLTALCGENGLDRVEVAGKPDAWGTDGIELIDSECEILVVTNKDFWFENMLDDGETYMTKPVEIEMFIATIARYHEMKRTYVLEFGFDAPNQIPGPKS